MGTIKIGSSKDKKGVTINPSIVLFNGNNVKKIMSGITEIWTPSKIWFNKGIFSNTDLFGTPKFVMQTHGINNGNTYATDGYINLDYSMAGGGSGTDSMLYTNNRIPRGIYSKVIASFILSEKSGASQHEFRLSMRDSQTNQSHIDNSVYYTNPFNVSNELQTQELDLTAYNSSNKDLYFCIGGGGNKAKIYNITFIPK